MADYVHTYTGAQIDEAVGKVRDINSTAGQIDAAVTKSGSILEWVEAQGESGGWYYQKFSGGQFVAFKSTTLTSSVSMNTKSATIALPFTLPNTVYVVAMTATSNGHLVRSLSCSNSSGSNQKTTTQFVAFASLSESTADPVGVDIIVRGYWK